MRPKRKLMELRDSPLALADDEQMPTRLTSIKLTMTKDGRRVFSRCDYPYKTWQHYLRAHRHDKCES